MKATIIKDRLFVYDYGSERSLHIGAQHCSRGWNIHDGITVTPRQAIELAKLIETPPKKM